MSDETEENTRHRSITNISCMRDQNQLSNIDGFCWENFANIYSDDPFAPLAQSFIASAPKFSSKAEVQKMACLGLARDKKLQRVGDWFPTCPGGDQELTTRVLDTSQNQMTGVFHIGEGGWLLEDRMNVTQEFCLTWDWDPRTRLDRKYRMETLHTLEAVFCDPCKNQVLCNFLHNQAWTEVLKFLLVDEQGRVVTATSDRLPEGQALRNFPGLALASYLDANQDGNLARREFANGKMVHLAKILFDGFDSDGDGSLEAVEVSLESLLRPAFLKTLAKELFQLIDINKDGFISSEDNLEFSLVMNLERNPTIIYGLLSVLDSDRDDRVVVAEVEELMIRFHSFLRGEAETDHCTVSLPMLVDSLRRLGVPAETLENILANLTPFLVTLPRALAASLIRSADKDLDRKVSWSEVEAFSDFNLVEITWPTMVEEAFQSVDNLAALFNTVSQSSALLRVLQGILYDDAFLHGPSLGIPC